MVNNRGYIIHKTATIRKDADMTKYSIYKENRPIVPKQVTTVSESRIRGCRKRFPRTTIRVTYKKRKIKSCQKKKKSTTKSIPKRGS